MALVERIHRIAQSGAGNLFTSSLFLAYSLIYFFVLTRAVLSLLLTKSICTSFIALSFDGKICFDLI